MYRYFDKSQSGSISKADFFHLMNKDTHYEEQKVHLLNIEDVIKPLATSIKKYNADIDDVFKRYDKDGNNMLSADELQNGLRHLSIFITNSDVKMLKDYFRMQNEKKMGRKISGGGDEISLKEFKDLLNT